MRRVVQALQGRDTTSSPRAGQSARTPDLILQKRIEAAGTLWTTALDLKERFSAVILFFTILVPPEYDSGFEPHGKTRDVAGAINDQMIAVAMKRAQRVGERRPDLADPLWSPFFVYRAFLGRLAVWIVMGKRNRHIGDWREDNGIRKILGSLFETSQIGALLAPKNNLQAVDQVLDRLQKAMLDEISRVSSGQQ